ncbi:Uncharacterised protein [Candidatus Burarchaeum australiense]|nr:Uncharacterised protein [Candidatus Burarchaeum australiense]
MKGIALLLACMLAGLVFAYSSESPDPAIREVTYSTAPECLQSGEETEFQVKVENIGEASGNVIVVPECTSPFVGFPSDPFFLHIDARHYATVSVQAVSETDATGTCTMVARSGDNVREWPITVCVKGSKSTSDAGPQMPAPQTPASTAQPPPATKPSTGENKTYQPSSTAGLGGCPGATIILGGILLAYASRC